MNIVIIPGFMGYPLEITFEELEKKLQNIGHDVIKISWPHFPDDLNRYCMTDTISHTLSVLRDMDSKETVILGFSMGGVIACQVAKLYQPKKLGLIVAPYQAGSEHDLVGKYKNWMDTGNRIVNSSKYGELNVPFSFIEDARQYNSLEAIRKVHCPTLFIVGGNDETVLPTYSMKLYEKANQPKTFINIEGMEHKYQYQPEMLSRVNEVLVEFIGNAG